MADCARSSLLNASAGCQQSMIINHPCYPGVYHVRQAIDCLLQSPLRHVVGRWEMGDGPNPAKGELAPAREGRRRANLPRVRALLQDWQLEAWVGNWQFGQDEACAPVIDGSDNGQRQ
jgi:hypothetical protein